MPTRIYPSGEQPQQPPSFSSGWDMTPTGRIIYGPPDYGNGALGLGGSKPVRRPLLLAFREWLGSRRKR